MSEPMPVVPLSYVVAPAKRDSIFGIIGLALALFCSVVPVIMLWMLLSGRRHSWAVYSPYAANIGVFSFGVNWPWFAIDSAAMLLGVIGLYRGRARFSLAAVGVAVLAMATVMTLVLGSPW